MEKARLKGLSDVEREISAAGFNISDHNVSFYEEILGTPTIIENILCYCDGVGIYVCAMPLFAEAAMVSIGDLLRIIETALVLFSAVDIEFVDVWGHFDGPSEQIRSVLGEHSKIVYESKFEDNPFESILEINDVDLPDSKSMKKKLRQLKNASIEVSVSEYQSLSYEHLSVIDKWMVDRDISTVHRQFFVALGSYVKKPGVLVFDARLDGALVGFSVVGKISSSRIVLHSAFPLKGAGLRCGDALNWHSILFAKKEGVKWVHFGYSSSSNILASKQAWGATHKSPRYREVIICRSPGAEARIQDGKFLWRSRVGG